MIVVGAKGKSGGGGSESPNTLQSNAKVTIVEALGEGEIEGLVDGLKSIYIDDTPIQNYDGTMNRLGLTVDTRTGLPSQDPILGSIRTGTSVSVQRQVKYGLPVVHTISEQNDQVQVIAQIPALVAQGDDGDLTGTDLHYLVQVRETGGSWVTVEEVAIFHQKCTSPYERVTLVNRPAGSTGDYDIQIVRLTADSTDVKLQNDLYWESYVALVRGSYQYPYTAIISLQIDSENFGTSLGTRTYHVRGLKTDVPSNYDPETRTYTGIWDGTFKKSWHSNPAWVFWDLITNSRYGLGEFVDASLVDKWSLYQIAQYCDQMVPSGFNDASGNPIMEPRFSFNGVINSRDEAYKVLQNVATAFRGMAYWSLGQVFASADMPQDPVTTLSPANVIDGVFTYSGTAMKARHSVALVGWNDPQDLGRPAIEAVQNDKMISTLGWRQVEVSMTGCNSRGLAHRYGKWILDTEQNETETVQFKMSWDGFVLKNNQSLKPSDIIMIADPRKNGGYRAGGRLAAIPTTTQVVLDFPFEFDSATYTITCMLPDGSLEKKTISSVAADNKTLTLASALSQKPIVNSDFVIESVNIMARRYRVMAVEEEDTNIFTVTALFNDPTKYARVEEGVVLEPIQYTRPRDVVQQITNPTSVESRYFQNGVSHSRLTLSWTPPNDFTVEAYNVTADSPRGFQSYPSTSYPSLDINDPVAGEWTFYISARSHLGTVSVPVAYTVTVEGWQAVDGPIPDNLQTTDGGNIFNGRAPTITWTNVFPPGFVTYPVTNIVRVYDADNSALLRTERVADARYTYTYENNINDGGPRRRIRFDVTALNVTGVESDIASITAENPTPAKVVPTLTGDIGSIDVAWVNNDNDYAGALVWTSQNPSFVPTLANRTYDGPDTKTTLWVDNGTNYVWIALYDVFGKDDLIISDRQQIDITDLESTLAQVLPDLLDAQGQVTKELFDENNESVADIIANMMTQIIADRDDLDELHKRSTQILAVKTDNLSSVVASETAARVDADYAEATARQVLEVTINTNIIAAIATEQSVRASADAAEATARQALEAIVNNPTTGVLASATAISSISTAVNNPTTGLATKASATSVSQLSAQINDPVTGLDQKGSLSQLAAVTADVSGVKVQYGVIGSINGTTGGFIFTGIKKLDGSVSYSVEIQGSLIVNGTIAASKLNVSTLSSITANIGAITAGTITSANGKMVIDLNNNNIIISD